MGKRIDPNKLLYNETLKIYSGAISLLLNTKNNILEKMYLTKYIPVINNAIKKKDEKLFEIEPLK